MEPAAEDRPDLPPRTTATRTHTESGRPYRYFFIELLIVTAGVLIALSVDGLREWNQYRMLVREARATIAREIVENKREVDISLSEVENRRTNIRNAVTLANDLLATKKSAIRQHLLALGGELEVDRQLAERLSELYAEALK